MLKKGFVILSLVLYLIFLFLPGLPLLNYYLFSGNNQCASLSENLQFNNNEKSHVGDGVYLMALMKRVQGDEVSKKAQNPPPRTNTESNTLIYIPAEFMQNYARLQGIPIHYFNYSEKILIRYGMVLLPPPNFV